MHLTGYTLYEIFTAFPNTVHNSQLQDLYISMWYIEHLYLLKEICFHMLLDYNIN